MTPDALSAAAIHYAWLLLPFVAALAAAAFLWETWLGYVRGKFAASQRYVLLRLVPPREVLKTPAAMEVFLTTLYQTGGEGNWYDLYWKGKSRPYFSLEIVSVSGDVRFYIYTPENLSKLIEAQLYAQYPGAEVRPDSDYVDDVFYQEDKYDLFGSRLVLEKPDPYPIKTYIDYGLVGDVEPEVQIDPIAPVVEFMGSVPRGHQAWIQIILRAHKKDATDPKSWLKKVDSWKEAAKTEIKKIREESIMEIGEKKDMKLTKGKEKVIEALERSVSKYGFDVGIRTMAIYPTDALDGEKGLTRAGLSGAFRQYNSGELNGFKGADGAATSFDYPWQDWRGKKLAKKKRKYLELYRARAYFGEDKHKTFVLNTEELATIFHLPSSAASAPTFGRVDSKRGEPPSNLPV